MGPVTVRVSGELLGALETDRAGIKKRKVSEARRRDFNQGALIPGVGRFELSAP